MKFDLRSGLLPLIVIAVVVFGGLYLYNPALFKSKDVGQSEEIDSQTVGVRCGGWDTFGEVVCECSGQLEEFTCPPNAVCDSGTDTCYGTCGECKCYPGPASGGVEIPCDGKDALFR